MGAARLFLVEGTLVGCFKENQKQKRPFGGRGGGGPLQEGTPHVKTWL